MAVELRKTGISIIGDIPWGTHFCHFYETKQDLLDTLVPYFKAGLESKEFCVWVVSDSEVITVEEAKRALAQVVRDLDRHLAAGNIEVVDALDWYLEKGVFNLEKVTRAWDAKLKRALALGYEGMRVSGDTFWLAEKDWKDFCAYEKQLNDSITDQPMTVLCTYPLARSGAGEILDVMQAHQFATARRQGEWKVIESPEPIQAKAEIRRLNDELQGVLDRKPAPPAILKYGVAVLSVFAAAIIARWMEISLHSASHVSLFLCAVMFSAWFGGVRPGLVSIVLSLMAFDYFFVPPIYSLAVETNEIPRLLIFAVSALFVGSLSAAQRSKAESLARAREVLDATVQELKRTNQALRTENAEREHAEALLHAKEQEFRAIVENTPDQIIRYDRNFRRAYVNPAVAKAYGLPAEALIGKPIGSVIEDAGLDVKEDELTQLRQKIANVFDSGQSCEYEVNWPLPTGRRYFSVRLFPELDLNGSVVNVLGISQDITERKQAEDALRRSEDHLRLVIDTIPTIAWSLRPDGVLDYLNQRWLDYTGLSLQEAIEEPTRAVHPKDLPRAMEKWLVVKHTSEAYEDEMRLQRADGEYRWFLVRIAPLLDEQGNLLKRYGVAIDITERKQAEEALDERLRFETLVTELSAAFASLSPNEVDREIDKWLQTLAEFLGVDRASFLQFGDDWTMLYRTHSYTVPGIEPLPPPPIGLKDQFPWITDQLRRGVIVKWSRIPDDMPEEAVKEKAYAAELGVKSGVSIPVLVGGSVICAITFTSIVTYHDWPDAMVARLRLVGEIFAAAVERKRAEEALRDAEQKYREIFENAGEGIFQSSPEGRFIIANPALARMHGFASPEELIHSRLDISRQIYVAPTRREEFKHQIDEQGEVRGFEHEVFRKDGSKLWISVNAHAVRDEQGAIQYYEGTAQDISERKAAEEKLKANSEHLRALSARLQSAREEEGTRIAREIHDELGSALTSLKWDLEEIDKQLSTPLEPLALVALREKFQTPMKLADLAITAIRRIASELRPSVLDDLGLVAAIEWQCQQFQSRTGIVCTCDCSLEKVELTEEQSTAVFRILQEALTNVLRHSQATKVDIKIKEAADFFVLRVDDNGKGITESKKSEQQPLGLLGMRERAHLIGGELSVTSVEGRGTVVTLRVPIAEREVVRRMTR